MRLDNFLIESIEDKGIFKCVFMIGQSGAGKTYTNQKVHVGSVWPRIVNIDKFIEKTEDKTYRPEFKRLTNKQVFLYINSLLPITVESTATKLSDFQRRVGLIESIGYDTIGVFINTPLDISLERAKKRKRKVNSEVIIDMYKKIEEYKNFYRQQFSQFIEIDNNRAELDDTAVLNVHKFLRKFYKSPVNNPTGKEIIERMKKNNWKYLTDGIFTKDYLEKLVTVWYI